MMKYSIRNYIKFIYNKMKRVILTLLTILSLHASAAMVEKEITIDFQKFPELTMSPAFNFATMSNNGQTNCTNYKILDSPLTLSFSTGRGTLGAAIYRIDDAYRLILRSFCDMIFEVSGGCQLTSIKFYNTNSISEYSIGRFDTNANQWLPNGATNVTRVTLSNGFSDSQLSRVTVKYQTPATPLNFESSVPSEGTTVTSFQTMQLTYNTAVSKANSEKSITLTGSTFTGSKTLSITPPDNSRIVTLSLNEQIAEQGAFTVHVPEGVFETSEGATNAAKNITFNVVPKRDTFNPTAIDPASGTSGGHLPKFITLTFPNHVKIGTGTVKFKQVDGTTSFAATVEVDGSDANKILIKHEYDEVDPATWTVDIPEKLFHTDFPETDADYSYNKALPLEYVVDGSEAGPQPTAVFKSAQDMLDKKGVGYPKTTTATYQALKTLVEAAEMPEDDVLKDAMGKLYNETDIEMPVKDTWYMISGENADGTPVYLTFNEDKTKVLLGTNSNKAAAFQVKSVEGGTVFQTKEGWFLHVPHTLPNYTGTSKKNLTTEESDVNKLVLAKFAANSVADADSSLLYGLFTIFGSLGTKNGEEKSAFATISYADSDFDFTTEPGYALQFSKSESSAFRLTETTEPLENVEYIHASISFSPSKEIENAGTELYYCITGPTATTILDNDKIYFTKDGEKQSLTQPVLKETTTTNKFSVYTEGLASGAVYELVAEEGAFKFINPDGKFIVDEKLTIELKIGEVSDTPTPDPTPSQTTLSSSLTPTTLSKAGTEMILTITNVLEASLAANAQPYFKYADGTKEGQKVSFVGAILSAKSDSKTQFAVNTANLEPGKYVLVLPLGSFTYKAEDGKEITDSEMTNAFTIEAPSSTEDYTYTYNNIAYVTTKDRSKKGIDVISDVDLNDFVICVYDFWGYSALYGNPNGKVSVRSTFGGDVVSGHMETYSTEDLIQNYGEEYAGAWALKFVPDVPITPGQLKNNPGMYAYYLYPGAIGDENYRKYLAGDTSIKMADCIVNPGMAASKYYVNNEQATRITTFSADDTAHKVIYDLQGRRVTKATKKGVYIINGKKVVVK